ncbi:MAG: hypothetical protein IPG23_23575 [Burkholderiales bacterium]|nr:hypothetical protein [Burkholderiales bacterium]
MGSGPVLVREIDPLAACNVLNTMACGLLLPAIVEYCQVDGDVSDPHPADLKQGPCGYDQDEDQCGVFPDCLNGVKNAFSCFHQNGFLSQTILGNTLKSASP